jgi:cell division septum initiation protein DivIVA
MAGKLKDSGVHQTNPDEVARLIEAIERDLGRLKADSADVQRLRQEVEALKAAVRDAPHEHDRIRTGLHGVRNGFDRVADEAVADGIEVSRYVNEIGRILGLG